MHQIYGHASNFTSSAIADLFQWNWSDSFKFCLSEILPIHRYCSKQITTTEREPNRVSCGVPNVCLIRGSECTPKAYKSPIANKQKETGKSQHKFFFFRFQICENYALVRVYVHPRPYVCARLYTVSTIFNFTFCQLPHFFSSRSIVASAKRRKQTVSSLFYFTIWFWCVRKLTNKNVEEEKRMNERVWARGLCYRWI